MPGAGRPHPGKARQGGSHDSSSCFLSDLILVRSTVPMARYVEMNDQGLLDARRDCSYHVPNFWPRPTRVRMKIVAEASPRKTS